MADVAINLTWERGHGPEDAQDALAEFADLFEEELLDQFEDLMKDVRETVQDLVPVDKSGRRKMIAYMLQFIMSYKDPETLCELYHSEQLTYEEIGERFGVGLSTIQYWMDKHEIDRRTSAESRHVRGTEFSPTKEGAHTDETWLREKYYGENWSVVEMAEEAGVTDSTIIRNMDKHSIDRRPSFVTRVLRNPGAGFVHCDANGYETIKHSVDDHTYNYKLHRLLAIALWGYDAVQDAVVHHKNGLTWDNRPENLELVDSQSEHAAGHYEDRKVDSRGRLT